MFAKYSSKETEFVLNNFVAKYESVMLSKCEPLRRKGVRIFVRSGIGV